MKKLDVKRMEIVQGGIDWLPVMCAINAVIFYQFAENYVAASDAQWEAAGDFLVAYC